jgi:hypothetical protein
MVDFEQVASDNPADDCAWLFVFIISFHLTIDSLRVFFATSDPHFRFEHSSVLPLPFAFPPHQQRDATIDEQDAAPNSSGDVVFSVIVATFRPPHGRALRCAKILSGVHRAAVL